MNTTLVSTPPASTPAPARPVPALVRGGLQRHEIAAGTGLVVLAGRLWITLDGDPDDHFVGAGQRWTAARTGRCVIQGDGDGTNTWRWLT